MQLPFTISQSILKLFKSWPELLFSLEGFSFRAFQFILDSRELQGIKNKKPE